MSAATSPDHSGSGLSIAAFVGCSAIWGCTFLVISIGNDSLAPLWAASLRLSLAATLLLALTRITRQSLPRGPALRAAAGYGVLNLGFGFCLLYWGETQVPSGITAVMYATIPLTTTLLTSLLGMERPAPAQWLAAALALVGVGLVFGGQAQGSASIGGLIAVLLAAILAALSGIVLKRAPHQSALGTNAIASLVGLPICLAASFLRHEPHPLPSTAAALLPLLFLTIAGSVGAFVLYTWLIQRWPMTRLSFIAVFSPLIAFALGVLVRHEPFTRTSLAGSALVIGGLLLMIAQRPRTLA